MAASRQAGRQAPPKPEPAAPKLTARGCAPVLALRANVSRLLSLARKTLDIRSGGRNALEACHAVAAAAGALVGAGLRVRGCRS